MGKYDEIINLPYIRVPVMSDYDRAAQFASFKSLTGFEDDIAEHGRWVDGKPELSDSQIEAINLTLLELKENIGSHPEITVIYFIKDKRKSGGMCVTETSALQKIDEDKREIALLNGKTISIYNIIDLIFISL